MKLLLLNFDLLLASKIQGIASNIVQVSRIKSIEEANLELERDRDTTLLMHLKPEKLSDLEKLSFPERTVGIYSHVEDGCKSAAEARGLKDIWRRSLLEKNLPTLLDPL